MAKRVRERPIMSLLVKACKAKSSIIMEVVEDFESRPHTAVAFLVEGDKRRFRKCVGGKSHKLRQGRVVLKCQREEEEEEEESAMGGEGGVQWSVDSKPDRLQYMWRCSWRGGGDEEC